MKIIHLEKASLSELFKLIEGRSFGFMNLFRGQCDESWDLLPSLYRFNRNPLTSDEFPPEYTKEERYKDLEQRIINYFFNEGFQHLKSMERNFLYDRILAQHYGAPTRLLDWSTDPLVALYFAVKERSEETDAALFMVLPNLMCLVQDKVLDDFNDTSTEKPQIPLVAFRPPTIDRRIVAQKSVFTIHPYEENSEKDFLPLNERTKIGQAMVNENPIIKNFLDRQKEHFLKIIIPFNFKSKLEHYLFRLGINERTLFPGLESIGREIVKRVKSGAFYR